MDFSTYWSRLVVQANPPYGGPVLCIFFNAHCPRSGLNNTLICNEVSYSIFVTYYTTRKSYLLVKFICKLTHILCLRLKMRENSKVFKIVL